MAADMLQIRRCWTRRPSNCRAASSNVQPWRARWSRTVDLILLDEPLANLDFKLREEMRDELPRLFAERNCVVVYATTEPTEALLLGGQTAAMHEGRVVRLRPNRD